MSGQVYPVHNNVFRVTTDGRTGATAVTIADMETFSIAIDGNVEEWTPMELAGWIRRAVTGKGLTIGLNGKRAYGDPGNDYIASMLLLTGTGVETVFEWDLPDGATLVFDCVINLTNTGGGDSTNIGALEFEALSDGLPVYTPAP